MEDSERRQKLAELEVLERFDAMRSRAGHDYGSGQRGAELMRLRRRLEVDAPIHGESRRSVEIQEVAAAFERVGRPRLERARRDVERRGGSHTPTSRRTVETWERLEKRLRIANRRQDLAATPSAGGMGGDPARAAQGNLDEKRELDHVEASIEEISAAAREDVSASIERRLEAEECEGHPAGPFDPMGQTVYCDGSCQTPVRVEGLTAEEHREAAEDARRRTELLKLSDAELNALEAGADDPILVREEKGNLTALLAADAVDPGDPHGLNSTAWSVVRKDNHDRVVEVVAYGLTRDEALRVREEGSL